MHRQAPPQTSRQRGRGFTLVELLIAVAVVAILLAVALPSFLDSIRKGRRADAFAAIAALQQAQERWRSNNASYTATTADLAAITPIPAAPNYTVGVAQPPAPATLASSYVVTAEGRTGTSQASDGDCRRLSVWVDRGTILYAGCASCTAFTYAASNACWAR